jgi:hypothetical protein
MKTTSANISVRWFEALNGKLTAEISSNGVKKVTTELEEIHCVLRMLGFDSPRFEDRRVYVELKPGDVRMAGDEIYCPSKGWIPVIAIGEQYSAGCLVGFKYRRPVPGQTYRVRVL